MRPIAYAILLISLTTQGAVCAGAPQDEINLLDASLASRSLINCGLGEGDGSLALSEGDSLIDLALEPGALGRVSAPCVLELTLEISADIELEEYLVYWVVDAETEWREFVRVPIRPDGQQHTYRLPLHARGEIKALRIAFGKAEQHVKLLGASLRGLPVGLPAGYASIRESSEETVELRQGPLTLAANLSDASLTIHDERTGRTWRSAPACSLLTPYSLKKHEDSSLTLGFYDRASEQSIEMTVELGRSGSVRFTVDPQDPSLPLSGARFLPPRFSTEMQSGRIVFCDRSCGVLLEQTDTTYASWPMRVYGNTNCLDMPWVGLFDNERGDGVMLLVETPTDAEVALVADPQGRHWPEVRWLASLDAMHYPRVTSLRFTEGGRHVALAGRYREHLKQQGQFKTLEQKAKEKPEVERLRGAPSLWGGRYPTKFVRQMRPLGIDRGVVNTCRDPGLIRWLNDQGYLTGRYDSYTDFTQGPTAFQSDDVEKAAIVPRPGGRPKHGWKKRSGEQMYWRSSARWQEALASYTPQELARLPYNARFIDVAAAAELMEDHHPDHTQDRREDLANRRAMFERMNEYGLVLGTEHGNDWSADLVDYFEGTMSGPFWWSSWPAGYLDRPKREQLTPRYLKYGMGYTHRVPLWELVYHDCANTTWYWGDTAGLLYEAAPELSDRKDLFNLLYGTTPLFWMNNTGYRLPDEIHRMLRTFHDTCQFQKQVAFEQMTDHEFLSEDGEVQRTSFANGAVAVVNFAEEPREYVDQNSTVVLAPRGYLVRSPDFRQQRTIVDGETQTLIDFPGYLAVDSAEKAPVRGVKGSGRFTTFQVDEDTWNVFTDPGVAFEVNLPEVTGWDAVDGLAIHYLDDLGEVHRVLTPADSEGVVRFTSHDVSWRFALVRTPGEEETR